MEEIEKMNELLKKHLPKWDLRRISFMSKFIIGMIQARSVNLQKISESFLGEAKVSSNYRRCQRFFKDFEIDMDIFAKMLSSFLPKEKWILAMDRTNWKVGEKNINILFLSVVYKGIAIPLLWEFLGEDKNFGKRGNSNTEERKEILNRFIKIFGTKQVNFLVADREFIGKEWLEFLNNKGIRFIIRIRKNTIIENNEEIKVVKDIFKENKKDEIVLLKKKESIFGMELNVGGKYSSKSEEPLILISNFEINEETFINYKKRWNIETMFSLFKSKGFNLEESKLYKEERIEKLLSLLALAFIFVIEVGEWREEIGEKIAFNKKKQF